MSTSTPSPRRVIGASSKANRNAAVVRALDSKSSTNSSSVSTTSTKASSAHLPTPHSKPNHKSTTTTSDDPFGPTFAHANVNAPPAIPPDLNLKYFWREVPGRMPPAQSKMAPGKIPLRAICEDALDESTQPNVDAPPTLFNPPSRPKTSLEAMYSDLRSGEVDMNPKNPKSPKTSDTHHSTSHSTSNLEVPVGQQKVEAKKKKKKSKKKKKMAIKEDLYVPPARIRSPTMEEKQERLVENFKLYDNPFQKQYERISAEVSSSQLKTKAENTGGSDEQDLARLTACAENFERDRVLVAKLRAYPAQDDPFAASVIKSFEEIVTEAHARGEHLSNVGMNESTCSKLFSEHDFEAKLGGSAVVLAQDFSTKPNNIFENTGSGLAASFKAALERASGMVVGGTGGVGTYQAGTVFGGRNNREMQTLVLESKERETILKLGEGMAHLTIDEKKDLTVKELKSIRARVLGITNQAMKTTNGPRELALAMHDLFPRPVNDMSWVTQAIVSKVVAHPPLRTPGFYGVTVPGCVNHIIDKIYPLFPNTTAVTTEEEKVTAWCELISSSIALWELIGQDLNQCQNSGLQVIKEIVDSSLHWLVQRRRGLPHSFNVEVVKNATIWFVEEYSWTGGNIDTMIVFPENGKPSEKSLKMSLESENGWMLLGHLSLEMFIQGHNFAPLCTSTAQEEDAKAILEAMRNPGRNLDELENPMSELAKVALERYQSDIGKEKEQDKEVEAVVEAGPSRESKYLAPSKPETPESAPAQATIHKPDNQLQDKLEQEAKAAEEISSSPSKTSTPSKTESSQASPAFATYTVEDFLKQYCMCMKNGGTILEAIQEMFLILAKVSKTAEEELAVYEEFLLCGAALWMLIDKTLTKDELEPRKGLGLMADPIWYAGVEGKPTDAQLSCHTHWFLHAYFDNSGDMEAVKKEALLALEEVDGDLSRFVEEQYRQVNLLPGMEKMAPLWASPVSSIKPAVFEEEDDVDKSHESKECVAPFSVPDRDPALSPSSLNQVNTDNNTSTQINTDSSTSLFNRAPATLNAPPTFSNPSSSAINNKNKHDNSPETDSQENLDTNSQSDNMQSNIVPPTPPMTSEELSSDTKRSPTAEGYMNGNAINADHLSEGLKDVQSKIATVDGKVCLLDNKIHGLRKDNKDLKAMIEELKKTIHAREESNKAKEVKETEDRESAAKESENKSEQMRQKLLDEVRGLQGDVEKWRAGMEEGRAQATEDKEGDNPNANAIFLTGAQEPQDVVERHREEVLWPQGDVEPTAAPAEVTNTGAGAGGKRELYVKIGNQAGRGQGGGGFCVIM